MILLLKSRRTIKPPRVAIAWHACCFALSSQNVKFVNIRIAFECKHLKKYIENVRER